MNRRELLAGVVGSAVTIDNSIASPMATNASALDERAWARLDAQIQDQWARYISRATEEEIRKDSTGKLMYLPFPYISPSAPGSIYRFMFSWDTDFISRALIAQGLVDLARNHLLNHFFMIDRFDFMPNANYSDLTTRSQTPLIADTTWRYFQATGDRDLLLQAYPRLKQSYRRYWTAAHHQTPIGLATNHDSGDARLAPRLAAEAETGLDWTPIYAGDVRRCVPLVTNCALVRYAEVLAAIARTLGETKDAKCFAEEATGRAALIRKFCWSEAQGFFLEYDFVAGKQLPCLSDCAFWTLWAGVASAGQARQLVRNLKRIEQPFGLSCTDKTYSLPTPTVDYGPVCRLRPDGTPATNEGASLGGAEPMQWMYPAGWAPSHVIAVEGLDRYGFKADSTRITRKFLGTMVQQYERTGQLWEKYNVVDGSLTMPNARCGNIWMQGWTAAAVALLGRRIFRGQSLAFVENDAHAAPEVLYL